MKRQIQLLTITGLLLTLTSCGSLNFFQGKQSTPTAKQPVAVPLPPPPVESTDTSGSLPQPTTPPPTSNVIPVIKPTQAPQAEPAANPEALTAIPPKKKKIVPLNGSTAEPMSDKPNTE